MNRIILITSLAMCLFGSAEIYADESVPTHQGGCILLDPIGDIPDDVYKVTDVVRAEGIAPFTKELTSNGLRLVGQDNVSDDFMRLVGRTISEIFPQDVGMDLVKQREVLENHYRYRAFIPIPVDGDFSFMEDNPEQMELLQIDHSICDIIMQGSAPQGQVMEVVEHILHFVTDIGLHYAYPEEWGINKDSSLAVAMQGAIENGYYVAEKYDEFEEPGAAFRVKMQEFAYWFITTAWDLQAPYGPIEEDEWTIRNSSELRQMMPDMYAVFDQTVGRIMVAPSRETLGKIGPIRNKQKQ